MLALRNPLRTLLRRHRDNAVVPAPAAVARVVHRGAVVSLPHAPYMPRSDVAAQLRRDGKIRVKGAVTRFDYTPGQSTTSVGFSLPALTQASQQAGGQPMTLTLDNETAMHFPPHTPVEVIIRPLGDEWHDEE